MSLLDDLIMPPEKVAARRNSIGASDLPVIMGGDSERILKLWNFKRGAEQDDLSNVLPVMLGCFTERFTLAWLAKVAAIEVEPNSKSYTRGFMSATPDAFSDGAGVDAKHVGTFKSDDDIGAYYAPQLFAQMSVCRADRAILAVLKGNADFFFMEYAWDDDYGSAVVATANRFWYCVQSGEPPVPLLAPPAPKPKGVKVYDMSTSNAWAEYASMYSATLIAAGRHESAKKEIKALVPSDASKCVGHGLVVKRDARGALRFSMEG